MKTPKPGWYVTNHYADDRVLRGPYDSEKTAAAVREEMERGDEYENANLWVTGIGVSPAATPTPDAGEDGELLSNLPRLRDVIGEAIARNNDRLAGVNRGDSPLSQVEKELRDEIVDYVVDESVRPQRAARAQGGRRE